MKIPEMLNKLKAAIRSGSLTPAKQIDGGTFICLKEINPNGEWVRYRQVEFELLPKDWQRALKNKTTGEQIAHAKGFIKIIAIFDAWPKHDLVEVRIEK